MFSFQVISWGAGVGNAVRLWRLSLCECILWLNCNYDTVDKSWINHK